MISVVVGLLLYSIAMLVAAPPLLKALTYSGNAPRLGVATWLSAIGTVVASWLATAVLIIVEVISHWAHPRTVAASCLARLQHTISGDAGIAPQITLVVIAAGATVAAAITGVRLATAVLGTTGACLLLVRSVMQPSVTPRSADSMVLAGRARPASLSRQDLTVVTPRPACSDDQASRRWEHGWHGSW